MKNLITIYLLAAIFFSCAYDDGYYADEATDFSEDISNIRNFYFDTPVALSLLNSKIENDTAYYKVGDTLKLSLKLNNIYQATKEDTYNLFKSTDTNTFSYSIYLPSEIDEKIIDLKILNQYPELSSGELSKEEIATSPFYNDLYIDEYNIEAVLNENTNQYESEIGLVLTKATSINEFRRDDLYISVSQHISNYEYDHEIYIHIPIFSIVENSVIYVD